MTLDGLKYNVSAGAGLLRWVVGNYDAVEFEWVTSEHDTGTYTIWFYVRDGFDDYSDTYQKKKFTLVVE
jgi:hypothetical protein